MVNVYTQLSWKSDSNAKYFDVYFSTDLGSVMEATTATKDVYKNRINAKQTSFNPVSLNKATHYYWRIDEVSSLKNIVSGNIWMFVTEGIDLKPAAFCMQAGRQDML